MKNNLINDPSPYLQQHKDNPVFWQAWNNEALLLAKKEKKPILLSVGYASCHWCHVMAHESFEDKETADLMNNFFVNIKVDREERPDIDFVFQSSYQLFNQAGGGWPLTMFLDENAVPFMGGTYFPKISQHGLPAFKDILKKIGQVYKEQRLEIINQSNLISKNLELKKNPVLNQDLESILKNIINNLDKEKGGYIGAPKFPIFNVYDSLIYFYQKTKKKEYLEPVKIVLKQLCSQGIYDHVEGGISRYTVDEDWLIPHFEKMLYDNAQFISLASKYYKLSQDEYFKKKIIHTINFIKENFINKKNNLIGSAYDADSEGEEGKYYVFSYEELKNIKNIDKYFSIKPEGNWEGKIILQEIKLPTDEIIRELKKIRFTKKKPFFDNKTQLDLNCLWVSSLINAHKAVPDQKYLDLAESHYKDLEKNYLSKELYHSNSNSIVFLEDYAYAISMLLDLHEQTLKPFYQIKAKELSKEAIEKFYIKDKAIFQKNKVDSKDLFHNAIDISDHTIPNGNSIMLNNFARLGLKKEGKELANSLNGYLNVYKNLMISSIKSIDFFNQIMSGKNCNDSGCEI